MFRDLRALLPILGGYERVKRSLAMMSKLFPCRDLWVVCTQRFMGPTDQSSWSGAFARRAHVFICQAYLPYTQVIPLFIAMVPLPFIGMNLVSFLCYTNSSLVGPLETKGWLTRKELSSLDWWIPDPIGPIEGGRKYTSWRAAIVIGVWSNKNAFINCPLLHCSSR